MKAYYNHEASTSYFTPLFGNYSTANSIEDSGVAALSEALKVNHTLTLLNLRGEYQK